MSGETHQYCPLCRVKVTPSQRYPRYLCADCDGKATDEDGRLLVFSNESFSGGFIAQYADTGEARDSHLCFVDGVKCRADEARFGGIIIQPVEDSVPRRV
jgi:hypothetical protein